MPRPQSICRHHLFLDPLGPESVVVDLGAYEGDFGRRIRELTSCRVIAVEADPDRLDDLRAIEGMEVVHAAVADRIGSIDFYRAANQLGSSILPEHGEVGERAFRVPATTLEELLAEHGGEGRIDVLKVNIEGAEIPMLAAASDATLARIDQIAVQFHDFLPELALGPAVAAAKRRLAKLGFGEILFKSPNKDVLFVNLGSGRIGRGRFEAERAWVQLRQYGRAVVKKLGAG